MTDDQVSNVGASAFLCADEALAQQIARALKSFQVPCVAHARPDGRGVVAVPQESVRQASQVLSSTPGIVVERGAESYFRRFDPTRDQNIFDHPVLREPVAEIRKRGAVALEDLYQCVIRGNQPVMERAIMLLGKLGTDGHPTLDRLAILGTQMGNSGFVGLLIREGKFTEGRQGASLPELLIPLKELVRHQDSVVRAIAVRVLGGLKVMEAISLLADALMDSDPDVAIEADDAFLNWGARDEGFEPDLDTTEKLAIVAKRKQFRPR